MIFINNLIGFYIAIIIWGLYRIYDGMKRIKFEDSIDNRINDIPDTDVKNLWKQLSSMNHRLGKFYQLVWGPYLIFSGILNILMCLLFTPTFSSINMVLKYTNEIPIFLLILLMILLLIGLLLIGENDGRLNIGEGFPLSFIQQKKAIYYLYSGYDFCPRKNWSHQTAKDFASSHEVHFERYQSGIDDYVKNINKAMIGIKVWYLTLIILFFYFSTMLGYVLILIHTQ